MLRRRQVIVVVGSVAPLIYAGYGSEVVRSTTNMPLSSHILGYLHK